MEKEKKWEKIYTVVLIANLVYILVFYMLTQLFS